MSFVEPICRGAVGTLCLLLLLACDDNPSAPTFGDVAGTYVATVFTANTTDVLAAGGSLDLELASNGTVQGSLFVPASAGGPFTADMVGTYSINGSAITFEQTADTFVRDADWTWSNAVLSGSWTGGGTTIVVQMAR